MFDKLKARLYVVDMANNVSASQASAAVELIAHAYQRIASAGDAGMPSGNLYALMMNAFDSLAGYESMVALMERTKLVSRKGHLLIAARL